jgi:uncharacterized damage-inducible protein DinB
MSARRCEPSQSAVTRIEMGKPQWLVEELAYLNQRVQHCRCPIWRLMVHVVNHCSYDRGQITTLLHQLGAEAASTDLRVYYNEKPKKLGWPAESR